jgi:hypothetical protein
MSVNGFQEKFCSFIANLMYRFDNSLLPERALEEHWCAAGACGDTSPPSRMKGETGFRHASIFVTDSVAMAARPVASFRAARSIFRACR